MAESLLTDDNARYSRQSALAPPKVFADTRVVVVGCGAVGHQVVRMLAACGIGHINIWDDDLVAPENLAPQMWGDVDLDKPKVEVASAECRHLNSGSAVTAIPRRFGRSDWKKLVGAHVFACVDNMTTRTLLWEAAVKAESVWLGDVRVAGETVRVISSPSPRENGPYSKTIFTDEQAYVGDCATRMVTYGAVCAASMLVGKFCQFARGADDEFSDQHLCLTMWDLSNR